MTDNLEYEASEAQPKWAELLEEVERGRTVCIARGGRTIARVVPETGGRAAEVADAIERLKTLRQTFGKVRLTKSWRVVTRGAQIGVRYRRPGGC